MKTPVILRTLAFYVKYQGWNSYKNDPATKRSINALERLGFLEVNQFGQARYTGKVW